MAAGVAAAGAVCGVAMNGFACTGVARGVLVTGLTTAGTLAVAGGLIVLVGGGGKIPTSIFLDGVGTMVAGVAIVFDPPAGGGPV